MKTNSAKTAGQNGARRLVKAPLPPRAIRVGPKQGGYFCGVFHFLGGLSTLFRGLSKLFKGCIYPFRGLSTNLEVYVLM